MKHLLLVRHGLVDSPLYNLNEDGRRFAVKLKELVSPYRIESIITDSEKRCVDTIEHLSKSLEIEPVRLPTSDFENPIKLLNWAPIGAASVICYRYEPVNLLLEALELPTFTSATRDSAYEFIWSIWLEDNGKVANCEKLGTGFRKVKHA